MKKKMTKMIVIVFSLLFIFSACGTMGTENPHTTTIAPTTEEITTEKIIEATEQTEENVETTEQKEAKFSYQVEYSGTVSFKNNREYFALFTSLEDMDKLDSVSQEMKEKYDEKWFETHSFVFLWVGHGSCCFADVNQVQFEDGCLTVSINRVKTNQEDLYKEKGKDYQLGEGGNHHDEAALSSSFIIEFDKNGEEMLGLLEKIIYKVRDWPSRDYLYVTELRLRNPEVVESTEQTEAFSYQIEYGDAIYYKDWRKHYFALFTSPEDMDKLDGVSQEKKEKYDEKWFETHSFAFISLGHGSCCFADVNWVQFEEGCLTVAINFVSKNQEDRYKEKGKDYQLGEGGNHHDEALVNLYAILEFDKNGEEMLGLLEKLIVKVRDWPSRDYLVESEIPLREPEPPVLELEDIPFIAGYRWTEKGKYKYANEYLYGYEKWGDKMVVSSTMSRLRLCFDATDSEELQEKGGFISRRWNSAAIYTMLGLKPSYDCEVKKVSIEDETLRVYADVVHKHWDQLTEAEQAEITSGKVSFLNETDENKYEMYLAIKTEYREEYVELMKELKKGVLVLRDVMSGKTVEVDLEFFSLIDKEYLPY